MQAKRGGHSLFPASARCSPASPHVTGRGDGREHWEWAWRVRQRGKRVGKVLEASGMLKWKRIYLWSRPERWTAKLGAATDGELGHGDCGHGKLGMVDELLGNTQGTLSCTRGDSGSLGSTGNSLWFSLGSTAMAEWVGLGPFVQSTLAQRDARGRARWGDRGARSWGFRAWARGVRSWSEASKQPHGRVQTSGWGTSRWGTLSPLYTVTAHVADISSDDASHR